MYAFLHLQSCDTSVTNTIIRTTVTTIVIALIFHHRDYFIPHIPQQLPPHYIRVHLVRNIGRFQLCRVHSHNSHNCSSATYRRQRSSRECCRRTTKQRRDTFPRHILVRPPYTQQIKRQRLRKTIVRQEPIYVSQCRTRLVSMRTIPGNCWRHDRRSPLGGPGQCCYAPPSYHLRGDIGNRSQERTMRDTLLRERRKLILLPSSSYARSRPSWWSCCSLHDQHHSPRYQGCALAMATTYYSRLCFKKYNQRRNKRTKN